MSEQAISVGQPKETRGRPSVYGPVVTEKLIGAFQLGLSVTTACEIAGINPDTMYDWISKYDNFSEKISGLVPMEKSLQRRQYRTYYRILPVAR